VTNMNIANLGLLMCSFPFLAHVHHMLCEGLFPCFLT
jgi:hypothetical protein